MAGTGRFLRVSVDVFNYKYVRELIEIYIDFAKNEEIPESIREELIKKANGIIERHREEVIKLSNDGIKIRNR